MSTWLINEASPESIGLRVVGGTFRSSRASSVQLARAVAFDAAEILVHDQPVVIKRDGSAFFRGKVRAIDKSGSAGNEGHDFLVEDAWAELERLVYQEPWPIRQSDYTGLAYSPTVILGLNSSGSRINVGQQIGEVLAFAVAQGLSLAAGSMPSGMLLWPSKVNGMSCADVIRDCLKYNPDWVPWIDHSTSPPTFQVTPRVSASTRSLAVTACSDFRITKTQDRIPEGVRIVYLTAAKIGEQVHRTMSIDQWPAATLAELAQPAAPGVIVTTVELAGMQVQIQKQQVQTRTLPTTSSGAKDYLRKKFPAIKDLADSDFNITEWTTAVIPEEDDAVDPIDVKLERIPGSDRSDLPRELVKGAVHEWMQKKIGRVLVEFKVAATGTATEEETAKLEKLPPAFTVVATDAVSKVYKGIASYADGDSRPTGIAQAYYNTIVNGCYFEGSAVMAGEELDSTAWHGSVLNITGGVSEWSTMKAPIHAVSWNLSTCETTLDFGPNPEFGFQDFLEFLKLLNKRPNNEYTFEERTGDEIGSESGISAAGDSVGAFDTPETVTIGGGGGGSTPPQPFELVASGTPGDNILKVRESTLAGEVPSGFTASIKEFTISSSTGVVYAKLAINGTTGAVTARDVEKAGSLPANTDTVFHELIGSYTVEGSGAEAVISASNARYGPIPTTICRNWFAAEAPFYGVNFG